MSLKKSGSFRTLKPKVLGDVFFGHNRHRDAFSRRGNSVYFGRIKILRIPLFGFLKLFIFVFAAITLVFGSVSAPTTLSKASGQSSDEERRALEAQLQELEKEISEYENQIISYQKQGSTFKGEIARLNDKIAKLNLQIQAINLSIRDLDRKIEDTKSKILITEETITANKRALGRLLQNLYQNERASLIEIFLKNPQISDFFGNIQGIVLLQNSLRVAVAEIIDLRDQLNDQKEQLSFARADAESAKRYQQAQKSEIDATKAKTAELLAITQGQESKYQELLQKTKATASEIRKRIFKLLGGGELSFEEAYNFAKLASGATGVRSALILAVLDRESALGQNVGRCNYKEAMHPTRDIPIFLEIVKELNINPDAITVSCPIRSDGAYGGAMGPAQFIPSTWDIYRDRVSRLTGNNPPSPWNNADAFMATALYLSDMLKSSSCIEYSRQIPNQAQTLLERCAAAKYYAGSRWYSYRWTYGEAVITHAARFEEDIRTITS